MRALVIYVLRLNELLLGSPEEEVDWRRRLEEDSCMGDSRL